MITFNVDNNGQEFPECPLRTDLHSCGVTAFSNINSCPIYNFDEDETSSIYDIPDWCPLRNNGVLIKLKNT
jgi:hypothetical protein